MKTSSRSLALGLTFAAAALFGASAVRADTVITGLPFTITSPGTYVLTSNLNSTQTTGHLITVNASNVTIDLQNFYIAGPATTTGSAIGIYAYEKSNITIRNGTVAYVQYGIEIEGNGTSTTNSVDAKIDNMRITYCSYVGIFVVDTPASLITNCQVSQGGTSTAGGAYGIAVEGAGITVSNNVVASITATTAYDIYAQTGDFVRQNTSSGGTYGVYGGKYQDNLTSGTTTPYTAGTDAGGNN